jgi:hypothetical protein
MRESGAARRLLNGGSAANAQDMRMLQAAHSGFGPDPCFNKNLSAISWLCKMLAE